MLSILHVEDLEDEEKIKIKENLLKEANLLQKEKNSTRYKKDKHKSKSFNDGY